MVTVLLSQTNIGNTYFFPVAQESKSDLNLVIVEVSRSYKIKHTHVRARARSVGLLWTSDQLAAATAAYTIYNKHKGWTFINSEGFELVIPGTKRPQTYALDRTATGSPVIY